MAVVVARQVPDGWQLGGPARELLTAATVEIYAEEPFTAVSCQRHEVRYDGQKLRR